MIGSVSNGIGTLAARGSYPSSSANKVAASFHHLLTANSFTGIASSDDRDKISAASAATVVGSNPDNILADAFAAYEKEAKLTPAQRARRDILEKMHLTEDSIKAMPAQEQEATEKVIAEQVAHRLKISEYARSQVE